MFSKFSESERKLLVDRLHVFDFIPLVLDSGLDLVEGTLIAANDDRGIIFFVDLASGFDRATGIPDKYLGYLVDDQLVDVSHVNLSRNKLFESIVHHADSLRIEHENLDGFSIKLQSNLASVTKTEKHVLTKQRLGQQAFRDSLIVHWKGKCVVTGMSNFLLLRASHIKPWARCKTDAERLDVHNGLLLSASYDAAFDAGLITFDENGGIIFSSEFSEADRLILSDVVTVSVKLGVKAEEYMRFHRKFVFVE